MTTSPPQHASQHAASQPSPSIEDYNTQIDSLLTRYLHLLGEYTTHRSSLSSLQAGMYQNLARANFAAERGVRYGRDYFDERMVASRRVRISPRDLREGAAEGTQGTEGEEMVEVKEVKETEEREQVLEWRVVEIDEDGNELLKPDDEDEQKNTKESKNEKTTEQEGEANTDKNATTRATSDKADDSNDEPTEAPDEKERIKKFRSDPLRWFGLLTPLPLRLAQTQAIQAVEQLIPRLVTVSAEMAQVEIEVRRARKRREKAVKGAKGAKGVKVGTETAV